MTTQRPPERAGSADMEVNRRARKYAPREQVLRILWVLARPAFRFSPRPFFAWRRLLLRLFGARVGAAVNVYGSAVITMPWNLDIGDSSAIGEGALIYNLGRVSIGSRVTVSQRAHLCAGTHDHTRRDMQLLKPPISVENDAWICADAFVGPGVTVGAGAVVGARAVAVKDVPAWTVVVGNPARSVGPRLPEGRWSE
jgi:putative colanic acid biosynthesis acetyltransferase WcaF